MTEHVLARDRMNTFPGIFPSGTRGAVTLAYDDALSEHLDNAISDLEAANLRGTFYVGTRVSAPSCFQTRSADWRAAAARGHELGNHTQYHPCSADWVKPNFRLEAYTIARMEGELVAANCDIAAVVGNDSARSFAYPCSQDFVGPEKESYRPMVARLFPAARLGAGGGEVVDPMTIDFAAVPSFRMDKTSKVESTLRRIDEAVERGGWAVLLFHGVGGGHDINVSREFHRAICKHIAMKNDVLWCDTFLNIAMQIRRATNLPWH